ncbi:MAG: hypothetical protein B9S38_02455 [Verrucomicrobiia bacterium Tous-C4TDCM]|nr:MAG: hypothetical protein B9S38_02455 [Verrucomicrobiae bacterium Tous-C4TDCM]
MTAETPKILDLTAAPHPKARVRHIDAAGGFLTFDWLNAAGEPVDSGGSTVRFEPLPLAAEPDDATLVAAIEAPPPSGNAVVALTPLQIRSRMTMAELLAMDTSTDPAVIIVRNNVIAAQEVRSDDPRTAAGKAILIDKGILSEERAAEVFA